MLVRDHGLEFNLPVPTSYSYGKSIDIDHSHYAKYVWRGRWRIDVLSQTADFLPSQSVTGHVYCLEILIFAKMTDCFLFFSFSFPLEFVPSVTSKTRHSQRRGRFDSSETDDKVNHVRVCRPLRRSQSRTRASRVRNLYRGGKEKFKRINVDSEFLPVSRSSLRILKNPQVED